jgi:hypothetical protein
VPSTRRLRAVSAVPDAPEHGIRAAFVHLQRVDRGGTCFRWFRSVDGVLLWPTSALHAFIAVEMHRTRPPQTTRRVTRRVTLVRTMGTKD